MAQYETTTATILDGRIGTAMGGDGRMSFIPVIRYQYTVNGQTYTNDRFTQNPVGRRIQSRVQKILDQYPPNSTVEIFYDVNNPADSFIQKGFGNGCRRLLYGLVIISLIALVATLVYAQSAGWINLGL